MCKFFPETLSLIVAMLVLGNFAFYFPVESALQHVTDSDVQT